MIHASHAPPQKPAALCQKLCSGEGRASAIASMPGCSGASAGVSLVRGGIGRSLADLNASSAATEWPGQRTPAKISQSCEANVKGHEAEGRPRIRPTGQRAFRIHVGIPLVACISVGDVIQPAATN
jgi:hypothetical protein